MTVALDTPEVVLHHGDCIEVMRAMPDASVDSIVTDPPYGLEFMGDEWGTLKPGGKRPTIGQPDGTPFRSKTGTPSWGANGNPACINCGGQKYGARSCSCDAPDFGNHMAAHMAAFQQWVSQWAVECKRVLKPGGYLLASGGSRTWHRLAAGVEDAGFEMRDSIAWLYGSGFPKSMDVGGGMGTALKPAFEPIVVARKPPIGTIAKNLSAYGTGAINIDPCRISGRFPTNVILDESQALGLDEARFFYTAKADSAERPVVAGVAHPTIKPLDLMRYLVRLVTPKGGVVLEPFAGSGTTLEAAVLEGFRAIGIEREADYLPLIMQRLDKPHAVGLDIFGGAA